MKKKFIILLAVMLMVSGALIGCKKTDDSGAKDVPAANDTPAVDNATKVGLVLAGGLGDRSFYDSSHEGVEQAKKDLGIEYKVYECRNDASLLNDQLVQASQYASIVAVVGHEFYDAVQEIAGEFPEVSYIYVDNEIEGIDNLITVSYAENEGSFLAGALAAMLTTETSIEGIDENKLVGMVGGRDIPVIRNFQAGYEAGVKYIDPEVEVKTLFAEDFEDPAKGKENATTLYSMGADIVFQVAGKTGEGVFEAAKEMGKYAIGVDTDQRHINPDVIVASMVKKVGKSIYETIENIQNDKIEKGKVVYYGLSQDGVEMGYGTDDMVQFATEDMKAKLEDIKAKIISGEIKVPTGK
ncbi:BMP family protein [Tissierella sp. P1]|uniref:BMP family lipoprotein n=1 Tax=Tissierella sp. P1 TaxID=1280483 RepID=UPI001913ECC6|nr:BMP family ABC transporter substrate-binding protein [Tissierella sp. P1]